jgi:sulfonate transport system ATP-binding protein
MPPSIAPPTAVRTRPAHPVSIRAVAREFAVDGGILPVLRDIDLDIRPGEIVALLGTSGSGKSTLLRQVCGLDAPSSGQILIDGSAVRGVDPRCAVAFQEPRLLPWRSLAQNIAVGLPRGTDKRTGASRVAELLALVGLDEFRGHRPKQVSGGMAQRAALARALARSPGVLLLDEPFGALDALTRLKMQDLLLDVHAAEPSTVLLVTHDVDEALYLADRIVLLATSPGGRGNTIGSVRTVPGLRPRDRAFPPQLAELRMELLEGLGVPRHHDDLNGTDRDDPDRTDHQGHPAASRSTS